MRNGTTRLGPAYGLLLLVCVLLPATAMAATFETRLQQANSHLRSGDATRALELYRELQVDYPDEDRVIFGIGCAQYEQAGPMAAQAAPPQAASQGGEAEAEPTAADLYDEAAATFDRLTTSRNADMRANAAFNEGNCMVRKAKFLADQTQREEAIKAYRRAIDIYDRLLETAPNHAGARQNLDHARYELKLLLQQEQEEPPEPPKAVSVFINPGTQIPGAQVVLPEEEASQLQLVTGKEGSGS